MTCSLLSLEEKNRDVFEVEVDEVFRLYFVVSLRKPPCRCLLKLTMGDKTAKIPSYNAMPGRAFTFVELCEVLVTVQKYSAKCLSHTVRLM